MDAFVDVFCLWRQTLLAVITGNRHQSQSLGYSDLTALLMGQAISLLEKKHEAIIKITWLRFSACIMGCGVVVIWNLSANLYLIHRHISVCLFTEIYRHTVYLSVQYDCILRHILFTFETKSEHLVLIYLDDYGLQHVLSAWQYDNYHQLWKSHTGSHTANKPIKSYQVFFFFVYFLMQIFSHTWNYLTRNFAGICKNLFYVS